jgi:hypothetical protein
MHDYIDSYRPQYSSLHLCEALKIAVCNLEGLSHGLKPRDFIPFEFLPDTLKALNRFLWVEPLSAPEADFRNYFNGRGVEPAPQKLFYLPCYHLPPA